MTALEYMEKQLIKNQQNYDIEEKRGAPEEMLNNIDKKIRYYQAAVDALRKEEQNDR
jgi:DnaJ-domain-containing protein 1